MPPGPNGTVSRRFLAAGNGTQGIFGAVRLDNASFIYLQQEEYFQWETYLAFLQQVMVPAFYRRGHRIYLIQDNASYHTKQESDEWAQEGFA